MRKFKANKNLCIIQARLASTRLPEKTIKLINNKSVLGYVFGAAEKSSTIDFTRIAIPEKDSRIMEYVPGELCYLYKGDENDLISRFLHCYTDFLANENEEIKNIIRITSDCPILYFFPEIIDELVMAHIAGNYDYSWNRHKNFMPSGLDVEIFKISAFMDLYKNINNMTSEEKEHVTLYFRNNESKYNILHQYYFDFSFGEYGSFYISRNIETKLSIDTEEDFKKVSDIITMIQLKEAFEERKRKRK